MCTKTLVLFSSVLWRLLVPLLVGLFFFLPEQSGISWGMNKTPTLHTLIHVTNPTQLE